MDKLTTKSQEALAEAISLAAEKGNPQVEPLHLLSALLGQQGGVAVALLDAVGVNRADVIARTNAAIAALPGAEGSSVQQPSASRTLSRVISDAGKEATALGDAYISTEHLLMAVAASQSQAGEILRAAGTDRDQLAAILPNVRGSAKVTSPDPEGTFQALEKYGADLTAMAREGKMDPVIGRDSEIRRVVQVLSRRTKNNPVLIVKPVEDVNGVVATLGEALDILDAAPARTPIIVECMDTSNDIIADYWVYDQKMMQYLLGRYGANAPKRVVVATNGTLNAARQKAKADAALRVLPRLAYKPSGPWTAEDINALKAVDMIACRSNDTSKPEVLAAIKNHPEKPGLWWAGMTTAAHVDAARAASKAAGLAIEGWIMEAKEAAPGALSTALPVRP